MFRARSTVSGAYLLAAACVTVHGGCSDNDDGMGNNHNINFNLNQNANHNTNNVNNSNQNTNENTNTNINTNTNTNTNSNPVCGNGVAEPAAGESCDGQDLGGQTCTDVGGYNHGTLACAADCTFDTTGCSTCGNGVADGNEQCDGDDLGTDGQGDPNDCLSVTGRPDGTLTCKPDCTFDDSDCALCGDGQVHGDEACDEGAANCNDSPSCTCATNCTFPGCGNGIPEPYLGEQCDEGSANCNGPGCTCSLTCTAPADACGFSMDGVWLEIDYTNAYSAQSPDWTFSPTPGWTASDWAYQGQSWPEVWDVYNNINVTNDPIGRVAALGPSSVLQIMIGLAGLTGYSHATVCVEGRSISTTASVIFDVYNPLNLCGSTASMAHDWTVHAVGVDISTCLIPDNNTQAVRIEPSGGSSSIGIMRMRVTLHDAVY